MPSPAQPIHGSFNTPGSRLWPLFWQDMQAGGRFKRFQDWLAHRRRLTIYMPRCFGKTAHLEEVRDV